ncbi:MAG: hypothetical protein OXQ29_22940 [Rhodospirillaceae bacterium]|nr:hypothetical protein [Rhodospirillaceae bacterium]
MVSEKKSSAAEQRKLGTSVRNWWGMLNSPFAIWLLTSVVLGLATFSYNEVTRRQSESRADEAQAADIFFEARFRIRQMDRVVAEFPGNSEPVILPVFVGIKLGGIVSFPLGEEFTVWVNGSGTGNRALPSGRGFQNDALSGASLLDLWYRHSMLTCGRRPQEDEIAQRANLLDDLDAVVEQDVQDQREAFRRVSHMWARTRENFGMFLTPGPQFECPD